MPLVNERVALLSLIETRVGQGEPTSCHLDYCFPVDEMAGVTVLVLGRDSAGDIIRVPGKSCIREDEATQHDVKGLDLSAATRLRSSQLM